MESYDRLANGERGGAIPPRDTSYPGSGPRPARQPAHRLSGTARVTYRFRAVELDAMLCPPSAAENGESFNATGK